MDKNLPSMLKPALVAGVLFGVLAGLPYLDMLNFCTCCSMIIACGFVASWMYSGQCRAAGAEFTPGTGAVVGLIAAAFFAVATTIVGQLSHMLFGQPAVRAVLEGLREFVANMPEAPPESLDQLDEAIDQLDEPWSFSAFQLIWSFFMSVLFGAVFSTVGGLIGGAVFKVAAASPTPPPPSAPGSPPSYSEPGDSTPEV